MVSVIAAIRTIKHQEKNVAHMMSQRVQTMKLNIKAIFVPKEGFGYVFVEGDGDSLYHINMCYQGLPHVIGTVGYIKDVRKLESLMFQKDILEVLEVGDFVQVERPPLKGQIAKVVQINPKTRRLQLELVEMLTNMKVFINADHVTYIGKSYIPQREGGRKWTQVK
jgi:transcription elongation factor Spt5